MKRKASYRYPIMAVLASGWLTACTMMSSGDNTGSLGGLLSVIRNPGLTSAYVELRDIDMERAVDPTAPCVSVAPLIASPATEFPVVSHEFTRGGIHLRTGRIDGTLLDYGVGSLQYNLSQSVVRDFGNFSLRSLNVGKQVSVVIGEVYRNPEARTYHLHWGSEIHALDRSFVTNVSCTDNPSEPVRRRRQEAYTGEHFRLDLKYDACNPTPIEEYVLIDTNTDIRYALEPFGDASQTRLRIASALLPRLAGVARDIRYHYTSGNSADLNSVEFTGVETITFERQGVRIVALRSSMDPARDMVLSYESVGLKTLLSQVSVGGGEHPVFGHKLKYALNACEMASKDILVGVTTLQNKPTIRWGLGVQGGRSRYHRIWDGADRMSTEIRYPVNSADAFLILPAHTPNNPAVVRLDEKGRAVERTTACALDAGEGGNEELRATTTYFPDGGACRDKVDQEKVAVRDRFYTIDYDYEILGDDRQSCRLQEVTRVSGGHSDLESAPTHYSTESMRLPNGILMAKPTRIDVGGKITELAYTGGLITHFTEDMSARDPGQSVEIQYLDQGRIIVSRGRTGRYDAALLSSQGFLVETRINTASNGAITDKTVRTVYQYAPVTFRLVGTIGERGEVTSVQYISSDDARVSQVSERLADETSQTSYEYFTEFPHLVKTVTSSATKGHTSFGPKKTTHVLLESVQAPVLSEIQSQIKNDSPVTLRKFEYDPFYDYRLLRACGFSQDGSSQGCSEIKYYADGIRQGLVEETRSPLGLSTAPQYTVCSVSGISRETVKDGPRKVQHQELDWFGRPYQLTESEGTATTRSETEFDRFSRPEKMRVIVNGSKVVSDVSLTYASGGLSNRRESMRENMTGLSQSYVYERDVLGWASIRSEARVNGRLLSQTVIPGGVQNINEYGQPVRLQRIKMGKGKSDQAFTYGMYRELLTVRDVLHDNVLLSEYFYDISGRVERVVYPSSELSSRISFTSDEKAIQVENAERLLGTPSFEIRSVSEVDYLGRVRLEVLSPYGTTGRYTYNTRGLLDTIRTEYSDGMTAPETSRFAYDDLGRMTEEVFNGVPVARREFDGAGRVSALIDARGNRTEVHRSNLNRTRQIDYPDGTSRVANVSFPQDPSIMLEKSTQFGSGLAETATLHANGSIRSIVSNVGGENTVDFEYFNDGKLSRITSQRNGSVSTSEFVSYDSYDRPTDVQTTADGVTLPQFSYQYGEEGWLRGIRYPQPDGSPNGSYVEYARDAHGRLSAINVDGATLLFYERQGASDLVQNVRKGDGSALQSFTFNNQPNAIARFEGYSDGVSQTTFGYDGRFQLTSALDRGERNDAETYTYDANQPTLVGFTATSPAFNINQQYGTQPDGILSVFQGVLDSMFKMTSVFSHYDSLGRPVHETSSNETYSWSAAGLAKILNAQGVEKASYTQDPFGRYVIARENGVESRFVRTGGKVLYQKTGTQGYTTIYDDNGRPVFSRMENGEGYYVMSDPLNATVKGFESVSGEKYRAYYNDLYPTAQRKILNASGAEVTGAARDALPRLGVHSIPETGSDTRITDHRIVGPGSRFLDRDPMGYADGMNPYQYATGLGFNPRTSTDRTGLFATGGGGVTSAGSSGSSGPGGFGEFPGTNDPWQPRKPLGTQAPCEGEITQASPAVCKMFAAWAIYEACLVTSSDPDACMDEYLRNLDDFFEIDNFISGFLAYESFKQALSDLAPNKNGQNLTGPPLLYDGRVEADLGPLAALAGLLNAALSGAEMGYVLLGELTTALAQYGDEEGFQFGAGALNIKDDGIGPFVIRGVGESEFKEQMFGGEPATHGFGNQGDRPGFELSGTQPTDFQQGKVEYYAGREGTIKKTGDRGYILTYGGQYEHVGPPGPNAQPDPWHTSNVVIIPPGERPIGATPVGGDHSIVGPAHPSRSPNMPRMPRVRP